MKLQRGHFQEKYGYFINLQLNFMKKFYNCINWIDNDPYSKITLNSVGFLIANDGNKKKTLPTTCLLSITR